VSKPALSVLVPTYNRADLLTVCLDSVMASEVDMEIVVVDNASTDATPDLLQTLAKRDRRLRIHRQAENVGFFANMQAALGLAEGDCVALLGDDDMVHPGNFERKLALLDAEPAIGFVYSMAYRIDADGTRQGVNAWPGILGHSYVGTRHEFTDLLPACYINLQSVIFRRWLLDEYGGLGDDNEDLRAVGCDWDMLLRYCYHSRTAYLAEPLVSVRYHQDSHTESISRRSEQFSKGRLAVWRKWLIDREDAPVLDEATWDRMRQAYLPDLQYELGNNPGRIQHYLEELRKIRTKSQSLANERCLAVMRRAAPGKQQSLPSWWPMLWLRLQYQTGPQVLLLGPGIGRDDRLCLTEGTRVVSPEEVLSQQVDSLVVLGDDWQRSGTRLRDQGLFMVIRDRDGCRIEEWRASLAEAFQATVHLIDPEEACPYLIAFGWKGRWVENKRRVLMVSHQNALQMFGGGETQLLETLTALQPLGIQADVSLSLRLDTGLYDTIHIFSLFHGEKLDRLQNLPQPTVVSTIFWDYSELMQASAMTQAIFAQPDPIKVDRALTAWKQGHLQLEGVSAEQMQESPQLRRQQRTVLELGRVLLPNGQREAEMVQRAFGEPKAPIRIIANAVRADRFMHGDASLFRAQWGDRPFVLCSARLEPNKNQLMLIWALRDMGLPLVLAGKQRDAHYLALCRQWAGEDVIVAGELSPVMLASAYAAARVHALPSWSETPGLANLEAGLAGCALVVGNRGTEQEYLGNHAHVCDPGDWESIRDAVLAAWDDHAPDRQEARRQHILTHYAWQRTAALTAEAYQLADRPRARWFLMPDWQEPESWQPIVETYIRRTPPGTDALLTLYVGHYSDGDPEQLARDLVAVIESLGTGAERCADIELSSEVPGDGKTTAILTGRKQDAIVRTRFGTHVLTAEQWASQQ
jgi:glycosyltransferase involved in cell wall biosynthesis